MNLPHRRVRAAAASCRASCRAWRASRCARGPTTRSSREVMRAALERAAAAGDAPLVSKLLLVRGVDVNAHCGLGDTPLHTLHLAGAQPASNLSNQPSGPRTPNLALRTTAGCLLVCPPPTPAPPTPAPAARCCTAAAGRASACTRCCARAHEGLRMAAASAARGGGREGGREVQRGGARRACGVSAMAPTRGALTCRAGPRSSWREAGHNECAEACATSLHAAWTAQALPRGRTMGASSTSLPFPRSSTRVQTRPWQPKSPRHCPGRPAAALSRGAGCRLALAL